MPIPHMDNTSHKTMQFILHDSLGSSRLGFEAGTSNQWKIFSGREQLHQISKSEYMWSASNYFSRYIY